MRVRIAADAMMFHVRSDGLPDESPSIFRGAAGDLTEITDDALYVRIDFDPKEREIPFLWSEVEMLA